MNDEPDVDWEDPIAKIQREAAEADERVQKAKAEAQEALARAREAQEEAERIQEEAEKKAEEARELATRSMLEAARLHAEAAERAKEDLRPKAAEYEIEVTDVWDHSGTVKAIEFIAHGAPNFRRYGGRPPALRAYLATHQPWPGYEEPGTLYLKAPKEPKSLAADNRPSTYRDAGGRFVKSPPQLPRNREVSFERRSVPVELNEEHVLEACKKALSVHLDMVDAETLATAEPTDWIKGVKGKVRT